MISVLMVAFNHSRFIGDAVRSVLAQTREDWELVIVDDGSTDGTAEAAAGFIDPRVRLIRQKRRGIMESYRGGIEECKGEYLAFLEGDDMWRPGNLAEKAAAFDSVPGLALAYSAVELETDPHTASAKKGYLARVGSVPRRRPYNARFLACAMNPVPTFSCAMVRRSAALSFRYPAARFSPWLDWFFWNQAASLGPFFFLPEPLVLWRHHRDSLYARMEKKSFLGTKAAELYLRSSFFCRALSERKRW